MLILIYEIEQQFVISASSAPVISSDLESSSPVSLSRLSGLVLQSINCPRRKRLAVRSRSCSVAASCCLACSAAWPVRCFPCCLLLPAILVSPLGCPWGCPAPHQPSSQDASLLKQLQADRLRVTCLNHRTVESLRLAKTSTIIKSNRQPTPLCLLNHVLERHMYTFFEPLQGWGLHHCPGQPVPMTDRSCSKEIFLNIQSKPPLMQLEPISSCPITSYL